MKQKTFRETLFSMIKELRENQKWGTAHVYQSAYNSFFLFNNDQDLSFEELTPTLLKEFEVFLRRRKCSWNTVSTYMKVLKATYNRGIDIGYTTYVPRLFKHVYTGVTAERKRALEATDISRLINNVEVNANNAPFPPHLIRVKRLFRLMFFLRGIPFVDLAYLRKADLQGNALSYRRRKTGRSLNVTLTSEALQLLEELSNQDSNSPYLFSFITSPEGTEAAYHEYQLALRKFNHGLSALRKVEGTSLPLSSYTIRHTWATMAYYCEIHPGIISEALGHSSITVTETYLKPFQGKRIDMANIEVINYVKQAQLR